MIKRTLSKDKEFIFLLISLFSLLFITSDKNEVFTVKKLFLYLLIFFFYPLFQTFFCRVYLYTLPFSSGY